MTVKRRDQNRLEAIRVGREGAESCSGSFRMPGPASQRRHRWMRGFLACASLWVLLGSVQPARAVSDCVYGGTNFSDGAVACQSGLQYRCSNGSWESLDISCAEPPPAPTRSKPAECACTANDEFNCSAVDMICCVTLEGDRCTKRCCQRP